MSENRRKLKNIVVDPKLQFKYMLYFVAFVLICVGAMINFALLFLYQLIASEEVFSRFPVEVQNLITESFWNLEVIVLATFLLFAFLSAVLAIVLSHRLAGAIVAVCAQIDLMMKGDYSTRRYLRKNDVLWPVMDKIHELADRLKKK